MNAAVHRIAITQWRGVGDQGRAYVLARLERGDTKTSALRALKRRLSDEVFSRLRTDLHLAGSPPTVGALAAA